MILRQLFLCVIIFSVFNCYGIIDRSVNGNIDRNSPFQQMIENEEVDPMGAIARDEVFISNQDRYSNEYILNARLRLIVNYTSLRDNDYNMRITQLCNDVLNTQNAPYVIAYYYLGEIHYRNRNLELALENFRAALGQEINFMLSPGPCSYKGFAQIRVGQIEEERENGVLPPE